MSHDQDGNALDVGRKTRRISPALRRALRNRDRTCRFPTCAVTVCDGHHLRHWADGGETKLDNLVLLCKRHHRAVHEGGYRVERDADGELHFFSAYGFEVEATVPLHVAIDPSAAVLEGLLAAEGIEVGSRTGSATTDSKPCDYHWALDWIRQDEWAPESPTVDASAEAQTSAAGVPT